MPLKQRSKFLAFEDYCKYSLPAQTLSYKLASLQAMGMKINRGTMVRSCFLIYTKMVVRNFLLEILGKIEDDRIIR